MAKESRLSRAASQSVAFLLRIIIAGGGLLGLGFGVWALCKKFGVKSEDFKNVAIGAAAVGGAAAIGSHCE